MKKIVALMLAVILLFTMCGTLAEDLTNNSPVEKPVVNDPEEDALLERLKCFMGYWAAGELYDMLTLCAPEWAAGVEDPMVALFGLAFSKFPREYTVESISGTPTDAERTVTVKVLMELKTVKYAYYRRNLRMVREEDGLWYLDPDSLKTYERLEDEPPAYPEPAEAPAGDPEIAAEITGDTLLYYQPEGGAYYHLDPNCKRVHPSFLPLEACFTYAERNEEPYRDLLPCEICVAPAGTEADSSEKETLIKVIGNAIIALEKQDVSGWETQIAKLRDLFSEAAEAIGEFTESIRAFPSD